MSRGSRGQRESRSNSFPEIVEMLRRLKKVQEQARALGIFTNDRELLECERCGLKEDVDINGRLFTYFGDDGAPDSGLRFEVVDSETFRCPKCELKIKIDDGSVGAEGMREEG